VFTNHLIQLHRAQTIIFLGLQIAQFFEEHPILYRVYVLCPYHNIPPLISILRLINPEHILQFTFLKFKVYFNISLPSMLASPKLLLSHFFTEMYVFLVSAMLVT
jgi:hypothetical protein